MSLSLLLLLITALLGLALHLSMFRQWHSLVLYSVLLFATAYGIFPFATNITVEAFQDWLRTPSLVQNLAVLMVSEAFLLILAAWLKMKVLFGGSLSLKWRWVRYMPGVLWIPAFLFLQLLWLSAAPGQSFERLQLVSALGFALFTVGLARALRIGLPAAEKRLELKYLVHLLQILLSGVLVVSRASFSKAPGGYAFELMPLLSVLLLFSVFSISGFAYYKIKKYGNT